MTIVHKPDGATVIVGPVQDQAVLHGLLAKIRDLSLILVALNRLDADAPDEIAL